MFPVSSRSCGTAGCCHERKVLEVLEVLKAQSDSVPRGQSGGERAQTSSGALDPALMSHSLLC